MVGFGQLARDLRAGRLPSFAFIVPNLCNDTHDCGVAQGDRFLARTIPPLRRELGPARLPRADLRRGRAPTRAAAACARGGRIATVVVGPDVRRGARDAPAGRPLRRAATIERRLRARAPRRGRGPPATGRSPRLFRGRRVPSLARRHAGRASEAARLRRARERVGTRASSARADAATRGRRARRTGSRRPRGRSGAAARTSPG